MLFHSFQKLFLFATNEILNFNVKHRLLRVAWAIIWTRSSDIRTMPAAVTPRKPEPSEIEYKGLRFLITDRPSDASVEKYIEVCIVCYTKVDFLCLLLEL